MRKTAAIFLMLILLFNIGGYQVAIYLLQQTADQNLEAKIDQAEYDESQLVEIKVSLNMPYQERFTEFERHYGQIEIDGKAFNYVMRKIEGDVVIFKCIKNEARTELKDVKNDLARANSSVDTHQAPQKQNTSLVKAFFSEYEEDVNQLEFISSIVNTRSNVSYNISISRTALNTPHQPPELV